MFLHRSRNCHARGSNVKVDTWSKIERAESGGGDLIKEKAKCNQPSIVCILHSSITFTVPWTVNFKQQAFTLCDFFFFFGSK